MFGFMKVDEKAKRNNFDRHIEVKRKKRLFDIVFLTLSFIILNLILYLVTKV